MRRNIFDFENEERVESPERLNEYVRLTTPHVWVIVIGIFMLLLAYIGWGFFGTIPVTETFKCVVDQSHGYSMYVVVDALEYDGKAFVGKEATYRMPFGESGNAKVVNCSDEPLSKDEISDFFDSDYLVTSLVNADYSYILTLDLDNNLNEHHSEIGQIKIITEEVKPAAFLFR